MPRIPETDIERIKREVDLIALVQSKGIECRKHGTKDLAARCPFHEDATASLIITPHKNIWHCMGCGKGGSVFDFVMAYEGVSFRHAYEVLAQGDAKTILRANSPVKRAFTPKLDSPVAFDADDYTVMAQVIDYYHQRLKQTPLALEYLQKRGITEEAIDTFKIGYADRTLGLRLPNAVTKAGGEMREGLKKLGLLRAETGHEHFNGCVTFPITSAAGITEIYGRKVYNNLRPGTHYHLYLPGPHVGVFNERAFTASREIILCESIIDALTFWCAGFRHVTTIYGTEAFTDELWASFLTHKTERVYLAYDRDKAGDRAADRDAARFLSKGIECYRIKFPQGMDANDYARKVTPPDRSLRLLIQSAEWLGKGQAPKKTSVEQPVEVAPAPSSLVAAKLAAEPEEKPATNEKTSEPVPMERSGDDITLTLEERSYRVRGLDKNNSFEVLRVNLRVMCNGLYHVNVIDLYQARQRQQFIDDAARETLLDAELIKRDLGKLLLKLEALQEERISAVLAPAVPVAPELGDDARREALELLRDPRLLDHVLDDLHKGGLVGEDTNLLVAWLVTISRKLDRPLGVCVMSRSAAGKSSLLEAVGRVIPEEDKHQYTALTPQALFHMPQDELQHKALFVAEDVGAEGAAYSLKTMQSDGQLIMACTTKDETTGQMVTKTKLVRGPIAVFLTSTSRSIDDELLNRLLVLTIDESAEQTRRIHEAQRYAQTLEGIIERRARPRVMQRQQNIQRLIRPLLVRNPFREELTFNSTRLRSRRDNDKYLALINVMALVHQYQREIKVGTDGDGQRFEYIDVTRQDIARVDRLMADVLEQTTDELTPASRRMLAVLEGWATELPLQKGVWQWTRRQIRERTNWSDTQVRLVLDQLVDFEYLVQIGGGQGRRALYQLATSHFAPTSQSSKCEVAPASLPLVAAAKNGNDDTSHSSRRVHVAGANGHAS